MHTYLLAALLFLAACTAQTEETTSTGDASTDSLHVEQDSTERYSFRAEFPTELETLPLARDSILAWTDERKLDFVARASGYELPDDVPLRPWEMLIQYHIAMNTDRFTSVLASGYEYTGGAHGMPFYEAFNFDVESGRRLALEDLFPDASALQAISAFVRSELTDDLLDVMTSDTVSSGPEQKARDRLSDWIVEGTAPVHANFQAFVLEPADTDHAAGITFVIPPYQVAPYAAGTQKIFVPSSVFSTVLNPTYRDRFR